MQARKEPKINCCFICHSIEDHMNRSEKTRPGQAANQTNLKSCFLLDRQSIHVKVSMANCATPQAYQEAVVIHISTKQISQR